MHTPKARRRTGLVAAALEEEGEYLVEWYATPAYAIHQETGYQILAGDVVLNQRSINSRQWMDGFGTYEFSEGGRHTSLYTTRK